MGELIFTGNFTQQEAIPEEAINRAVSVMRSGRLHRYNTVEGEVSETALLESEFADWLGVDYCLACASGGYALQTALRAFGLRPGEPVLTNAFTLSPVPGAIWGAGGMPVLIETTPDLVIDLGSLEKSISDTGARILLMSHMRGHLADMDAVCDLLDRRGVALIEDCAHTMGASWRGRASGTFGIAACFSTQTYKHMNSGEGGLLVSQDSALFARAVLLSGSYMFYGHHLAAPGADAYAGVQFTTPNCSGRMDEVRAAILRVQLRTLNENVERWNERYKCVAETISGVQGIRLPARPNDERFVGSSIQFHCAVTSEEEATDLVKRCRKRGVVLKWFGADAPSGYTSTHLHWNYLPDRPLPQTDTILRTLFDMRLPLTFSLEDCRLIGAIIKQSINEVLAKPSSAE